MAHPPNRIPLAHAETKRNGSDRMLQPSRSLKLADIDAGDLALGVAGWGYARLTFEEVQGLRKTMPSWTVPNAPHHFFKYSDEQTILAVQALDNAIGRQNSPVDHSDWAVIAAPQFLGRLTGAIAFRKFLKDGAPGVSPQLIPQHSLHSVSGALSVLLGCHGPNVGVGGGPQAMEEGLLTAATLFEQHQCGGIWMVCTGWNPAPLPNREGKCDTPAVGHAFALALQPTGGSAPYGTLHLDTNHEETADTNAPPATVNSVVDQLIKLDSSLCPCKFRWPLSWGAAVHLQLAPPAQRGLRAA